MTNLQTDNIFEFRLGGGVTLRFGPPRAGDGGVARVLTVPALFRNSDLAAYFDEDAKPTWTVAPDKSEAGDSQPMGQWWSSMPVHRFVFTSDRFPNDRVINVRALAPGYSGSEGRSK